MKIISIFDGVIEIICTPNEVKIQLEVNVLVKYITLLYVSRVKIELFLAFSLNAWRF